MSEHVQTFSEGGYWVRGTLTALAVLLILDLLSTAGSVEYAGPAIEWMAGECRTALVRVDGFVCEALAHLKQLCLLGHA